MFDHWLGRHIVDLASLAEYCGGKMQSWGAGVTQEELMVKDQCFIIDLNDNIVREGSKQAVHTFSKETPRGVLHRAFSVFLFNEEGKLLLQQRAADKITFPNVWTNTCCSHPISGCNPDEKDADPAEVEKGNVPGVKNAAIRKLHHELGIVPSTFTHDDFKFLTRLHYWAADVVTHGTKSPWGEHEIDYILFVQKKEADTILTPNPEEVSNTRYVSIEELTAMMQPSSGLLWSPWFRIIAEQFLIPHWWSDLQVTLTTQKYCQYSTIYRFDPTSEHMGGRGKAGLWLGKAQFIPAQDEKQHSKPEKKQGAYGRVKTFEHSILSQLSHLDEVVAVANYTLFPQMKSQLAHSLTKPDPNIALNQPSLALLQALPKSTLQDDILWCDIILGSVSRSFAAVIRQLPANLCLDIIVFYLVLRALDTIEDDMEAFANGQEHIKIALLRSFEVDSLTSDSSIAYCVFNIGKGDERRLVEEFYRVNRVFRSLPKTSQVVIADITKRMANGMADFATVDLGQGTVTVKDYDLYCHYVAGLVGEGLTRLFSATDCESFATGSEDEFEATMDIAKTEANTMGLFLQKTNIIRDYLEDFVDKRAFWPQQIWRQYTPKDTVSSPSLGDFADGNHKQQALSLLNHLITNALYCVPECLQYMSRLTKNEEVYRFCAIPQVMAIATLAELYNNHKVRRCFALIVIFLFCGCMILFCCTQFSNVAEQIIKRC